jgi:predicted ATPase/class 3 adenylate cyclase
LLPIRKGLVMRLPTGTVTFLFTDIEGSTRLWEQFPAEMKVALARHDALLRLAIRDHDGYVFSTGGDAFCAAFHTAADGLAAARDAQLALTREPWPASVQIKVRMVVHTGAAELRDNDYFGQPLNRAARLLSAGHGGQVLFSLATQELLRDALPEGVTLRDMGERRLKDLIRPERVYQLVAPDLQADFPSLKTLDARTHNLPIQLTSFVGREREMQEVKALLRDARLVTLTGSGGAGKTRLSLQVGADLVDGFTDGVWFVELASLTDAKLVPQAMATVLGVKEQAGRSVTETLIEHLKDRELLLLLDNCEHLVEASAQLCQALLAACAKVHVLATSREPLRVAGESAYRVPSLATPDPRAVVTAETLTPYAAVQLFIDRAVAAQSTFQVNNANAAAVASLCFHLDGIPLAIELAAARVRSMTSEEINERLGQRFRLLTGGSRTALPRHQTLRALIDWSYDLLDENERALLCRLTVFAGGWMLAAAEQVCSGAGVTEESMVDLLASLADKSLLQIDERDGATRYGLLETVRQYAADRLQENGQGPPWRDRHLSYFLSLVEEAHPHLVDAEQRRWMDRLDAEHDNVRAALAWGSREGGDLDSGLRLVSLLKYFWFVRGYQAEGRGWCMTMLAQPGGEARFRAGAYGSAGTLARQQGDYAAAHSLYESALVIHRDCGHRRGVADALSNLGLVDFHRGEYASALPLLEEAVAINRECEDPHAMAFSLNAMGMIQCAQADFPRARRLLEESLAIRRETQNRLGAAVTLSNLGTVAACEGNYADARKLYEEGLAIRRELGDKRGVAVALIDLGNLELDCDASALPQSMFEQALGVFRELGDRYGTGESLAGLGSVAARRRDFAAALGFFEQSLEVHREARDALNIAKSLTGLGIVAEELGDHRNARVHIADALTRLRQLGDRLALAKALRALAPVACVLHSPLHAAQIWGGAERLREEINSPIPPGDRPDYERQIAAARGTLADDAAFDGAWRAGRAMRLEEMIDYALDSKAQA